MKAVVPLIALMLAACATVPPPNAGPTAGLGQVAVVGGLKIRPIEVVEDSRCPATVQCAWAGRLKVRARMNGSGWTQIRDMPAPAKKTFHQMWKKRSDASEVTKTTQGSQRPQREPV